MIIYDFTEIYIINTTTTTTKYCPLKYFTKLTENCIVMGLPLTAF